MLPTRQGGYETFYRTPPVTEGVQSILMLNLAAIFLEAQAHTQSVYVLGRDAQGFNEGERPCFCT